MKEHHINISTIVFIAILVLPILILIFFSVTKKTDNSSSAWNTNLTIGDKSAPNTLVIYTDTICPHCADLSDAINSNEFQNHYIKSKKLFVEIRVAPVLQDVSTDSVRSAQAVYCAANQKKFISYYNGLITTLKKDYFSKGIGTKEGGQMIPKLQDTYYIDIAKTAGLSDKAMTDCLHNNMTLTETNQAYNKTVKLLPYGSGVPYLVVNNQFTASGFDSGYSSIKKVLDAGGVKA